MTCTTRRFSATWLTLLALCAFLTGCIGTTPFNRSFALDKDQAREELHEMAGDPKPFLRPVVIIGGYGDLGPSARQTVRLLQDVTSTPDLISSRAFFFEHDFREAKLSLIEHVEEAHPGADEIDIIGISMGGLVARYAASTIDDMPRLKVKRIYTISTPHLGLRDFVLPAFDEKVRAMLPDSWLLTALDEQTDGPRIVPYVRLGDGVVGERNTAPPGETPIWMPNIPFEPAHLYAHKDLRIIADIARRLRGEGTYASPVREPLPTAPE